MMYGYDEVLALEANALQIDLVKPDRNALALDRSLWRLLQQACQADRSAACEIFGLAEPTAIAIAEAPIDNLTLPRFHVQQKVGNFSCMENRDAR